MDKILYIVSTLRNTGPTNQLFYIIGNLDRKKYVPEIVTLSPEPENSLKIKFVDQGISIHPLNLSRLHGMFNAKKKLFQLIAQIKPDLIHTQGIRSDGIVTDMKLDTPTLLTIRNYPLDDYRKKFGSFVGSLMAKNHINILKRAKNIIACSEELARKFKSLNDIQLNFIQNGVDQKYYCIADNDVKISIRKELKIDADVLVFIHSGSLIKRKNVSTLIESFSRLDSKYNYVFLVAGDGPEELSLKKQAELNKQIRFLDRQESVLRYYHCADFIVSASTSEGLPNAILEGMSCGLPVIASKIDSHLEIFRSIGDYPYFFNVNDSEQLSILLAKILTENYTNLSSNMRQIIVNEFTAQRMSGKYQKLYAELIGYGS